MRDWLAQQLERLALVDAVALHEDALRALDRPAPLERALELRDLLGQARRLRVAAQRELDRALDLVEEAQPREGVDAALGGARDEAGLVAADERDDRPARVLAHLVDEVERVLVVVVDDDDRQVGVLAAR